jgi:hypothetical protein
MRYLVLLALVGCGGSPKPAPAPVDQSSSSESPAAPASDAGKQLEPKSRSYPAPPTEPAPTGTWRVTLEFPRLQGRPAGIVADATGIYVAGAVLSADDARARKWVALKLDPRSAIVWSSVTELPRNPAPERIVLADGAVVIGGQDETHEAARMLVIERRDAKSGKQTWVRRFTARDPKCSKADCAGKDTFGSIAVHGGSVLYYATVDKPIEAAPGTLSLAKGEPPKASSPPRSDLRARDVTADETGVYSLDQNLSGAFSLAKRADGKVLWQAKIESDASRVIASGGGLILWGKTIEKWANTGELVWKSQLVGQHIDVAVDANAVYATVMIDAKPTPYFAIAKLDAASGAVQWVRKTSDYTEHRPSAYIAVDKDSIYVLGYAAEKLFVERRRKSDGALGEVTATARVVENTIKRK